MKPTVFQWVVLLLLMPSGLLLQSYAQPPALPSGLETEKPSNAAESTPDLPEGLNSQSGSASPSLPSGLETQSTEPSLPGGIVEDSTNAESTEPSEQEPLSLFSWPLHGFWEARNGWRTQNDPFISRDASLAETRLQLETEKWLGPLYFELTNDFLYDAVEEEYNNDLREAYILYSPLPFMDVRVGRQILTWGTGDLIFINDLFPKDWQSFFLGRDVEYLKAPADALKMSFYNELMNLDVVYTPEFESDRFFRGERISFWNDALGRRSGEDNPLQTDKPNSFFTDDEIALRAHRTIGAYELAFYGYRGFWKSPGGSNPVNGQTIFPALSVYGTSLRGNAGPGIGNAEFGYYRSEDDLDGDNPFIKNSELRFLLGYEQEIAKDFTAGVQYYLEYMMDFDDYKQTLPSSIRPRDEDRHVFTLRLTKLLMQQDLTLSFFSFISPSDEDSYIRLNAHYQWTDHFSTDLGSNIFLGDENHTFFGQFERNTNVYFGLRYAF